MLLAATAFLAILLVALAGPLVRRARREARELVPLAVSPAAAAPAHPAVLCRTLRVYFIKPSKYDDRGRVAHFWKGVLPNNTLTVLAALNEAYNRVRRDDGVYVETVIWDEQVDGPVLPPTIQSIQEKALEDGVEVIGGLAGVQTNQYPRGRDLALQFRRAGFPVLFGGFHVSGYPESRAFLESCGITTVVGEAETIWADILDDYLGGELRPSYSVSEGIRAKTGSGEITVPLIAEAQLPAINDPYLRRFASPNMTTVDTSRGCPFTCSYCSVKNVMGRTMRARDPQAAALQAVKEKYRRVCHNWHRQGVAVHCGYMIGFPFDGPESGRQSAEWLLEVGVDLASFFIVTPLPGTEDHDKAVREGTIADWDFNQYDSQHMVSHHPRMTPAEVERAYG